jgi:hypothetical protein
VVGGGETTARTEPQSSKAPSQLRQLNPWVSDNDASQSVDTDLTVKSTAASLSGSSHGSIALGREVAEMDEVLAGPDLSDPIAGVLSSLEPGDAPEA